MGCFALDGERSCYWKKRELATHPEAITNIPVPDYEKEWREQMEANTNCINNT